MESYDKIKLAKENLNLAVALLTAAQEGVITKSIITKYIYPSATLNSKWSPLQVADNTHLGIKQPSTCSIRFFSYYYPQDFVLPVF